MSRQPTWDLACELQAEMFDAAAAVGGLSVQLVYFRGIGESRASPFVANAQALRDLMVKIDCRGGHTQIGKVLAHVRREAEKRPVAALAYVGDAMEENPDHLCQLAGEIGLLGVRAFMFHEGQGRGGRAHVPRDRPADRRRLSAVRPRVGGRAARAAQGGRDLCGRRPEGARERARARARGCLLPQLRR